jgi:hypothetical protein
MAQQPENWELYVRNDEEELPIEPRQELQAEST